jgi:hypothetical protein
VYVVDGASSVPKNSAVPDCSFTVRVREKDTSKRYSVLAVRSWVRVAVEVGAFWDSVGCEERLRPGREIILDTRSGKTLKVCDDRMRSRNVRSYKLGGRVSWQTRIRQRSVVVSEVLVDIGVISRLQRQGGI